MCLFVPLSPASIMLYMSIKAFPRLQSVYLSIKTLTRPIHWLPARRGKKIHTAAEAAVGEESKYKPQDG